MKSKVFSPMISIIIPVYKVEEYIEKCLQSLLDQTYQNFEAIIVDDGNPDNSIQIAKALVGDDPRFLFLEKENGGLSSARNFGLDHTTGEYIAFLDSDDYFSHECLEKAVGAFEQDQNIDVIIFGYTLVDLDGREIEKFMPDLDRLYQEKDILLTQEYVNYSVWNRVYRQDIWKNQRFVEKILYEDKQISPLILHHKNIVLLKEYLHFYLQRPGSIMNSYARKNSVNSMLYIYEKYLEFLKNHHIYDEYKHYYCRSYIKYCFFRQLDLIISFSENYQQDCAYLVAQLDKELVNLKNIKRYYGIFSRHFIAFSLFKLSPMLVKNLLMLKEQFTRVKEK